MSNTKNLANLAALDDGTSGQVLQSTGSVGRGNSAVTDIQTWY